MKLLHTADWHLGKTLKGQSLLEDQKFILDEIFHVINDAKPDAVIIAGDAYDRAVPPAEAVELFNDTLNRFVEKKIPVLIIAGNHDSAKRLNFGSKFFARQQIFIVSKVDDKPATVVLEDEFGEIYFSLIPFFDSGEIRAKFFGDDSERMTAEAATKFYVDLARKEIPAGKRSVAIAHVLATGGIESESERKFVGTAQDVGTEIFSGYNYAALGHLHRPQNMSETVRYGGSPLKYHFDESTQKKSVTLVELDGAGNVTPTEIELTPRRDVVKVTGSFAELMKRTPVDDYAQIILTDEIFRPDASEHLRTVFPQLLDFKYEKHLHDSDDEPERNLREGAPVAEQFAEFFSYMTGDELNDEEQAAFEEILREVEREEAEQ